MDDDDLFDELDGRFGTDDDPLGADAPPAAPTFRATLKGRRLVVIPWSEFLLGGPGVGSVFRDLAEHRVTVADLTCSGEAPERELVVDYHSRGDLETAERVLARWAEATGYRRIWFPQRVVDFGSLRPLRVASVTCPACGHHYREQRPQFWVAVQDRGCFPNFCLLCGHDLPQWRVARARG